MKKIFKALICLLFIFNSFNFVYALDEETATTETPAISNDSLSLHASGAIAIDLKSGNILYEKDAYTHYYPASITKLMTLYLALENLDDNTLITASSEDIDSVDRSSSHIAIDYDEQLLAIDLEYAMMLASANDAANVLATGISGSISAFVDLMNETAASLGMENTHFNNANGLPDDNHYTCAYDMAILMRALMKNEKARTIMSTISYSASTTNKQSENRVFSNGFLIFQGTRVNTNLVAGKNGYTQEAGYTSVGLGVSDNLEVVMVVLNEPDGSSRYNDLEKMMDYCFANYKTVTISKDNIEKQQIVVNDKLNGATTIQFGMDSDVSILLPATTDESSVTYSISIDDTSSVDSASATLNIYLADNLIGSVNANKTILDNSTLTDDSVTNKIQSKSDSIIDVFTSLSIFDIASVVLLLLLILIRLFIYIQKMFD